MSSRSISSPAWLLAAKDDSHINHALHALRQRESEREEARAGSRHVFTSSHQLSSILPRNDRNDDDIAGHYSVSAGHANFKSNRYANVHPYDRTRVVVGGDGNKDVDEFEEASQNSQRYLNASWVRELFGGQWWIATQAPLPNTAHAYLSLIMQPFTRPPQLLEPSLPKSTTNQIHVVVQLTKYKEHGYRKADEYLPSTVGASRIWKPEADAGADVPSLKVTLLEDRRIDLLGDRKDNNSSCFVKKVQVFPLFSDPRQTQQGVIFHHMMYEAWPDFGVPEKHDQSTLLAFIRLVDQMNRGTTEPRGNDELNIDPPIMVNCSAGIGRTGTFIALSSLFRAYNLLKSGNQATVDIPTPQKAHSPLPISRLDPLPEQLRDDLVVQEVDSLREQRPGMVQRDEQVMLIYDILELAFSRNVV